MNDIKVGGNVVQKPVDPKIWGFFSRRNWGGLSLFLIIQEVTQPFQVLSLSVDLLSVLCYVPFF